MLLRKTFAVCFSTVDVVVFFVLLDLLLLGINNLSGSLDGLCETRSGPLQNFEADCFEDDLTCSCCIHCCAVPDDDIANCPTWEDCCAATTVS